MCSYIWLQVWFMIRRMVAPRYDDIVPGYGTAKSRCNKEADHNIRLIKPQS